jgi:glycosyltransferase involved in cell wall biosynthesis
MVTKIAYFQQNPVFGACEEYLEILIKGIKRKCSDWELLLLCPPGVWEQWHFAVGEWAQVLPASDSLSDLFKLFRRLDLNMVHVNDPAVKALAAARLARVPRMVMTYHTPSLNIQYNLKGKIVWWFGRSAGNLRIISLSKSNKQLLVNKYKFSPEQVGIIPHGLEPDKFSVQVNAKKMRQELHIPPEAFVIICVARLSEQKAHEILIDAFAQVVPHNPGPIYLLLVGEGERRSWLEEYAKRLNLTDRIRFLGYRDDVPQLLYIGDLFVLSSDFEGLPFAVLEAMAMGKPIIATAVDGIMDILENNRTGLLVPPRDSNRLRNAILHLWCDQMFAKKLGDAAKLEFEANYIQDVMVSSTISFYERLLG